MGVTICVPMEQQQESMNVPRSVPRGWWIERLRKVGISQSVS